jgi:hypothetical protein
LFCLLRERVKSSDIVCLQSVRDALNVSDSVVGEHVWENSNVNDAVRLMIDTGASTHMTNARSTLVDGSIVFCDVEVMGVGGAVTHIYEMGSVNICVGGRPYILNDVLLCEGAQLCAGSVNEPQVLVGVRKFAKDTGLGLCFPSNGTSVCVLDSHGLCVVAVETDDSQLYVIDRQDLVSGQGGAGGEKVAFLTLFGTEKVPHPHF